MSASGRGRSSASVVLVGCGAIGLPLAVALATVGRRVVGVDIDPGRILRLSQGRCDLVDEGLASALSGALADGAIGFAHAIEPADRGRIFIIAVPTPSSAAAGFEAGPLSSAAAMVAAAAQPGDLICIRSTVPIGATRRLSESVGAVGLDWAACPDRAVAGRAFAEQFESPHLVGGLSIRAADLAADLFASLGPVVRVRDPETAEAIKLFANVSRDVTFALANQFSIICEAVGIDISEVRDAAARDYPRFGVARPGPVGGPCLTKDIHVLAASEGASGLDLRFLIAAREVNEGLALRVASEILAQLASRPGPVAVLGMAFKGVPATLDQRLSFGSELVKALASQDSELEMRTWDPVATPDQTARADAVRNAAVVVLANDHPDLGAAARELPQLAPGALVYDLTGVLSSDAVIPGIQIRRFGAGEPRQ